MSYICLQSEKEDGTLNSSINEDIIFPKNSKCALVNLNMELIESVLNIKETTEIIMSLYSGNFISFDFEPKNYTNLTYWDVLKDLTTQANRALRADETTLGYQINFRMTDDYCHVLINSCPYFFDIDDWNYDNDYIEYDKTNDVLGGRGNYDLTTNNEQIFTSKFVFTKGVGTFRAQINEMNIPSDTGNLGFIIALVRKDIISLNEPILTKDLTFAINLSFQEDNYRYQHNGTWHTKFGTAPSSVVADDPDNDVVELLLDGGLVYYNVHQKNGVKHQLFVQSLEDVGINSSRECILYPIIIFGHELDEVSLTNIRCSFDADKTDFDDIKSVEDIILYQNITTLIVPVKDIFRKNQTLKFQIIDNSNVYSKSLSRFLGFPYKYYDTFTDLGKTTHLKKYIYDSNEINYAKSVEFDADFIFRPTFFSKMFFIEFTSQNLESFNSITGGQKNILLPIALHNQYEHHIISYEPKNLYFVDLHNVNDVLVRNYQFRILNENMEQVNTNGKSTITIVVQKK